MNTAVQFSNTQTQAKAKPLDCGSLLPLFAGSPAAAGLPKTPACTKAHPRTDPLRRPLRYRAQMDDHTPCAPHRTQQAAPAAERQQGCRSPRLRARYGSVFTVRDEPTFR